MKPKQILLRSMQLVFATLLLLCAAPALHAQQIAIKTNGLILAAMAPNAGCEFVVGERSSIDLSAFGSVNIYGNKAKILGFQPEYRYWFNGRPMTREYVGIAALGTTYDITWGEQVYKGDAFGAGITFGYALNLNKRLNVEFYGGFGAVYFNQKQHYKTDNLDDYVENGVTQANANGYKLLPIKLGVSISYILK